MDPPNIIIPSATDFSHSLPSRGEGRGEGLLPQIPNRDASGNACQNMKNNARAIAD
jgi:hypothetical protein